MTGYGVLVAVDGSPASDAAVVWAAREAALRALPMTVMHVVVPVVVTWPVRYLEAGYHRWQQDHGKLLVGLAEQMVRTEMGDSETVVSSEIRCGAIAPELITASKRADITVVGSRGLGAVGGGLLGSVSRSLLHYATAPVAVIHESPSEPNRSLPVLLGIDGSPASEAATALAFAEASGRGVDLVALHAWSDVSSVFPSDGEQHICEREGDEILAERLSGWQEQFPDVYVWRRVVRDRPAHWLIEASTRAQLVVLGRRGRGGFARLLLGSVSTTVAESSHTPVIIVGGAQAG